MIIGHHEIETKQVIGSFSKYSYFSHSSKNPKGIVNYVYCQSDNDFLKLLAKWSSSALTQGSLYHYSFTYQGYEGEKMYLHAIIDDNDYKIKCLLTDVYCHITYIQ